MNAPLYLRASVKHSGYQQILISTTALKASSAHLYHPPHSFTALSLQQQQQQKKKRSTSTTSWKRLCFQGEIWICLVNRRLLSMDFLSPFTDGAQFSFNADTTHRQKEHAAPISPLHFSLIKHCFIFCIVHTKHIAPFTIFIYIFYCNDLNNINTQVNVR